MHEPSRCPGCRTVIGVRAPVAVIPPPGIVVVTWACRYTRGRGDERRRCGLPAALVLASGEGPAYHHANDWLELERRLVARYGPSAAWSGRA